MPVGSIPTPGAFLISFSRFALYIPPPNTFSVPRLPRGPLMATVKELHINGGRRVLDADADRTLLSVLRDDLDLTGCKYGCGEGRCGACTVLVDGRTTRSCNTAVSAA